MLICYNCMFLTSRSPQVAHGRHIERSFTDPDNVTVMPETTYADHLEDADEETLESMLADLETEYNYSQYRETMTFEEYLERQNLEPLSLEHQNLERQSLEDQSLEA